MLSFSGLTRPVVCIEIPYLGSARRYDVNTTGNHGVNIIFDCNAVSGDTLLLKMRYDFRRRELVFFIGLPLQQQECMYEALFAGHFNSIH